MPDKRTHRGRHPADARLFSASARANLRSAVGDLSLLFSKGYAQRNALKLVGDRFNLTQRQRIAVLRNACSNEQLESRKRNEATIGELTNEPLAIDGYNLLITIESALSGGLIFKGRDGTFKDLASIHGTYRRVTETQPAVELIGQFLVGINISRALWFLDSPVSNSGRLKTFMGKIASGNNWNWEIRLTQSPDSELIKSSLVVASSDGVVLDKCQRWVNLAAEIIRRKLPEIEVIDLSPE